MTAMINYSMTHVLALVGNLSDELQMSIFKKYNIQDFHHILHVMQHQQIHDADFIEYKIRKNLLVFLSPVWIIIGTFGNILSYFVLRQPAMLKISTNFYLSILSVIDLMVLYVGLVQIWISEVTSYDIKNRSNLICKTVVVLGYFTSNLSVWLIVAVTVERYIIVCLPFKASQYCQPTIAKRVTFVLVVILLAVNIHFFWTAELIQIPQTGEMLCDGSERHSYIVRKVWPWVDATIYSFFPFFTITLLNCKIICRVVRTSKSRESVQIKFTLKRKHSKKANREPISKLTLMLLMISFVFLVTTLPMNILLILRYYLDIKGVLKGKTLAQLRLAETVTRLLMYANHATNIFLYCALGQKFRKQLIKLLPPWKNSRDKFLISDRTECSVKNLVNTQDTRNDHLVNYQVSSV